VCCGDGDDMMGEEIDDDVVSCYCNNNIHNMMSQSMRTREKVDDFVDGSQ
jgi:hypothetical protein